MIKQNQVQLFRAAVEQAKTIIISAHVGPDGDTIGSMLGLLHAFRLSFPHLQKVDPVISGGMPNLYRFMPGADEVIDSDTGFELLEKEYDLAFSVDCGSVERLGSAKPYFLSARQSINIDHHFSNDHFGKLNIIDLEAGASGEVVADLLMGNGIELSEATATCLYVAILTDTGGFKYASTSARIFDLAATFTRSGANPENIYRHIYEEVPKAQAMLQAEAIRNAQFDCEDALSWSVITQQFLHRFNASEEHVDGLVEALRKIDTVIVSAVLKETRSGITKVSLRSDVPYINVSDVAARWKGGGHKMAAGCTIEKPPEAAERELLPVLRDLVRSSRSAPV